VVATRLAVSLALAFVLPARAGEWVPALPSGFPPLQQPAVNPPNAAKAELGRRLFFDTRLSVTGSYSCASCHDPSRAFTDGLARARGATGEIHARNTPTLINAAYGASLGWLDQGVRSLEAQHRIPLLNEAPIELGFGRAAEARLAQLRADEGLAKLIPEAFDGVTAADLTLDHLVRALASYVRTLVFADSAFDRYVYCGEPSLSAEALAGLRLFLAPRTRCAGCHGGFNLSGPVVHALSPDTPPVFHRGIRAPTLRNVAVTAPYFHDGSLATLADVLAFYDLQGHDGPIPLDPDEQRALVAFLEALTDRCWVAAPPQRPSTRTHPRARDGCPDPP